MNKIEEALHKLFQSYRIIFWYDAKGELTDQFNELKKCETSILYFANTYIKLSDKT